MPFKSKEQERYLQINEPEIYRDWVEKYGHFKAAESFSAERKYQAVDVPLGMVCVLCENDKPATHRIVENGMPFFLCERHWFNYTMGAPNIDVDLSAESFGLKNAYLVILLMVIGGDCLYVQVLVKNCVLVVALVICVVVNGIF